MGTGHPGRWSEHDLTLSMALRAYEDGLCSGCGQPKDRVYGGDASGFWERASLTCEGCSTLHSKRDGATEPGQKDYLTWTPR